MTTPEQRATRNRAIAELCGWEVCRVDSYHGIVECKRGTWATEYYWLDAVRSLDDCKRAEEALGVPHINIRCGDGNWRVIYEDVSHSRNIVEVYAPTEAEARSAAIAAIRDAR